MAESIFEVVDRLAKNAGTIRYVDSQQYYSDILTVKKYFDSLREKGKCQKLHLDPIDIDGE